MRIKRANKKAYKRKCEKQIENVSMREVAQIEIPRIATLRV